MEEKKKTKPKPFLLFFFFFSSSVFIAHSIATTETQTLILHSLPTQPTLSWPELETDQPAPEPESTSLSVSLHHIDALSSNKTPHELFTQRLQRDASRVKMLHFLLHPRTKPGSDHDPGRASAALSFRVWLRAAASTSRASASERRHATSTWCSTPEATSFGSNVRRARSATQNPTPDFDPRGSKTFAAVPCGSPLCRQLDSPGCDGRKKVCEYQVSYGDGSFTVGDFSTETLTFRRRANVPRVALGCGHDNEGLFVGAAGLLGLGRGILSFPTQAGSRFNNKFSYCLVDRAASSKPYSMVFGDLAVSRVERFTPLLKNPKLDTFYYLELLGISVDGVPVRGISASLFRLDRTGNGRAARLKRAAEYSLFDTCFDLSGLTQVKVPTVVLHFRGADVSLPAGNYLIPVDDNGTYCFAFAGTMSGLSIIGNIQQQGFRVVFDLAGSRVGFAPRGCA
ncbi:hypothetical protein PIB30_016409 [Stylosanthes scabra]|uniref:Peptidase A1 domain-containing protein n=1 Tax=Stylosanthes scabra TaxID=79078 RepID=A0ABU6V9S7_9FABA|nr:hypothetical protein [Stylosanthes scabra]